jgi:hypothetical protein
MWGSKGFAEGSAEDDNQSYSHVGTAG